MDTTTLRKLAALGFVGLLFVAVLYLFALNQVADTTTPAMAAALDQSLARSLEPGAKCRVTMVRDGKGAATVRVYTARFRLSAAVAADAAASSRACDRATSILGSFLEDVRAAVTIRCVAEDASGATVAEKTFVRPSGTLPGTVPAKRPDPAPQGAAAVPGPTEDPPR